MTEQPHVVRVERNRGRVSLGRAVPGLKPGDMFEARREAGGVIVLTPVKVVPIHKKAAKGHES